LPFDFGTVPAGSRVRVKSRLRLYSASGFVPRLDDFVAVDLFGEGFPDGDFFAVEAVLARELFAEAFFAEAFFAGAVFAEVFFALVFFVTGRFTVRLRVVAMLAPWCEECADGLQMVGFGSSIQIFRPYSPSPLRQ
jgi:hypothetical protein